MLISGVTQVSQPSRSQLYREHDISWPVNTWIAMHYVTSGKNRVAYFNDARLLSYGHYLNHLKLRHSLEALVGVTS